MERKVNMKDYDDFHLWQAFKKGDIEAFELLYNPIERIPIESIPVEYSYGCPGRGGQPLSYHMFLYRVFL